MKDKPTVQIKNWGIYGYKGERRIIGVAIDHPRFEPDTMVTTSTIIKELKEYHDGDEVETRNTLYKLVGNNVNGSN